MKEHLLLPAVLGLLILLALGLSSVSCAKQNHLAKIVGYEYRQDANDGVGYTNVYTVIEVTDTLHRMIWRGYYGKTGDVFTVYNYHLPESVWGPEP